MNRRDFLQRFGIGLTAACALAQLPLKAVEALTVSDAANRCAMAYLRRVYDATCQAHPGFYPSRMIAGQELFEAYEGELVPMVRFSSTNTGPRCLMFRGARLTCVGHGWTARVVA